MASLDKPLLLGDFELETLEFLWAHGSGNAKEIHAQLGVKRGNTINTMQSTLERLYKKELLSRKKEGHSYQYECLYSRTDVMARKFNDLAEELAGGEMKSLFAAFVEFTSRLDDSKMDELEALIADYKKLNRGNSQ